MSYILIIYSSTDGHTKKICNYLKNTLKENKNEVKILTPDQVSITMLEAADKIVIGASIRYGKHGKTIHSFINKYTDLLASKPSGFFSVNLVARNVEKNTPQTNVYINKFLKQIVWTPNASAVFAGKLDYQKYNILNRHMIRLIMWMTNGPTDLKTNIDFTDWTSVKKFGLKINDI